MEYLVIENFNGIIFPIADPEYGETKVFDDIKKARAEASECQCGIVVPLSENLMDVIESAAGFVDAAKFNLGEGDDGGLEQSLNELLGRS